MTSTESDTSAARPRDVGSRAVRLSDLTSDLLWPRLLRAAPLALRPERLGIALLMLTVTLLIGEIGRLGIDESNMAGFVFSHLIGAVNGVATGVLQLDVQMVRTKIESLLTITAPRLWERYGFRPFLLGLPVILVWAVGGCAIARMAACDFSAGVLVPFRKGIGFALGRIGSLLVAVLLPLIVAALVTVCMAAAGWLLLGFGGIHVVGAVVYGLLLLAGVFTVALLACYVLGLPMLIPAVACEGADGIDAIQRAFAYVLGRPLRLLIFGLIALLIGWVSVVVLDIVAKAAIGFAGWASTLFAGSTAQEIVHRAAETPATGGTARITVANRPEGSAGTASQIVRVWILLPRVLVGAFAVSYIFSASTILYLLLRQVHDGQDWSELWMPGMIEGTMAEALRARAGDGGMDDAGDAIRIQRQRPSEGVDT